MTCTIVRAPQPPTFQQRLRRARIHSVFSNDQRTELEKVLGANNSARPSIPPRGKGPALKRPPAHPQRWALHFRDLQNLPQIDATERAANWIEGLAGLILLFLCVWAFVVLIATGVAR